MVAKENKICGGGDGDGGGDVVVMGGYWDNDDGGHICFGIYGGCGDRIVVEYGGVVFI